ncbi:transglutaminase domain-containing protein [Neobacillus mesonae]|uniref:transglutaminase domain-containing protein n=1 Tax=Neobacillus mesonae TaxID=1193713 RepID=UPI0025745AB1|nr:transglutaminase domain-containing protein [Neobacillus mesonae]
MKKFWLMFSLVTAFVLVFAFYGKPAEAAGCIIKNNQVLWDGKAVSLKVKGNAVALKKQEALYTKGANGKLLKSKSYLKKGSKRLVYAKVKAGTVNYYFLGSNRYLKASSNIKYKSLPTEIKKCVEKKVYNDTITKIVKGAKAKKTQFEKVLYVHDALANHITYDWAELKNPNAYSLSHKALGALVYQKAVCDGYTEAMNVILSKLHIESKMVTSVPMNHAWNLVKVDGQYYHVDVTWDDQDGKMPTVYMYFLVSDKEFKKTRKGFYTIAPHYSWYAGKTKAVSEKYANISNLYTKNKSVYRDGNYFYTVDEAKNTIYKTTLDGRKTTVASKIDGNIFCAVNSWIIVMETKYINDQPYLVISKIKQNGKEKYELAKTNSYYRKIEYANNTLTLTTAEGKTLKFTL